MFCKYCGKELPEGAVFCSGCGKKIQDNPGTEQNNRMEHNNDEPKAEGYEIRLEDARKRIEQYFSMGPNSIEYKGKRGYDAIVSLLNELSEIGGIKDSRYYTTYADFYVRGNIEGVKDESRKIADPERFVSDYSKLMDSAILNSSDSEKEQLQKEKEARAEEIRIELAELLKKKCPNCKAEIPDDAVFCGNCGYKLSGNNTQSYQPINNSPLNINSKSKKSVLIAAGIVVAIIVFGYFIVTSFFKHGYNEKTIIANAESVLCEVLVDPSSVSWHEAKVVERDDYDRFIVYFDITSTTKKGGRERNSYYVIIRMMGNQFQYKKILAVTRGPEINLKYLKERNDWGKAP